MFNEKKFAVRAFKPPPSEPLDLPRPTWELEDIDLEIGAGAGLHSVSYCLQNPDRKLVALERTAERFSKLMIRREKYPELNNLFCLRADAQWWASQHLGPSCLKNVFILYPNPYPKQSQANHRWHRSPFMGFLLTRMQVGGRLTLATNIKSYFDEANQYFGDFWKLEVRSQQIPTDFLGRTHFELKYLKAQQTCYEICVKKPADWDLPASIVSSDEPIE